MAWEGAVTDLRDKSSNNIYMEEEREEREKRREQYIYIYVSEY